MNSQSLATRMLMLLYAAVLTVGICGQSLAEDSLEIKEPSPTVFEGIKRGK